MSTSKIEIYTNENCSYCKQVKEELNNNDIKFEEKLTKDNTEEWQGTVNLTGMAMVPTIKYHGEFFVPSRDFQNPQQLIHIIETFESSSYTDSKRVLERMKTFSYNINVAFGRLDQLLRQIETKINTDEHKSTD